MPVLTRADHATKQLVSEVLLQHRPDLAEVDLRLDVLMASPKEGQEGPALKLRGRACVATVRILPVADRVAGAADARITLCSESWDERDDRRRRAVIYHELLHLELSRDGEGAVKIDDAGRPKLRMRQHDFEVGWFAEAVSLFGQDAEEAIQWREVRRKMEQLLLPFMSGGDAGSEAA